jgi:glycosyltransferase involved in cell wall biosynthesis
VHVQNLGRNGGGFDTSVAPLVSIIIPTHNYGHLISETITSALNQTYKNIEIIVVDDDSVDNTREVVSNFNKIAYIHQVHKGNRTPARAMNNGINNCRGDFIICLGADDKLTPRYVESCLLQIQKSSKIGVVYTGTQEFGATSDIRFPRKPRHRLSVLRHPHGQLGAMMVRRQLYLLDAAQIKSAKVVGLYDERLHSLEDWDFVIRASLKGWKIVAIPEPLHQVRIHDSGRVTGHANEGELYSKYPYMRGYILISRVFDLFQLILTKPRIFVNRIWNKLIYRMFDVVKRPEYPSNNQHVWVNEKSILKKIRGSNILDCACGVGRWGYLLKGRNVVGIDLIKSYLSQAKKYEEVVLGSVVYLPFRSNYFDTVLAIELIEHLSKEEGILFLREIRRVSKHVVLSTPKNFEPVYFGDTHPETHRSVWARSEILEILQKEEN